jgi:chromosome segregation ATPase
MKIEKKPLARIITGVLFMAIVVTGSIILYNNRTQIKHLNTENDGLNTTIRVRDSLVNVMTATFDEIEQNLTFIRDKRSQLSLASNERSIEKRDILVADIKLMNEMLVQNSIKIEELDKKLKASGFEIQSFKNKIAKLNTDILAQNNSIKKLSADLAQRDSKIAEMNVEVVSLKKENSAKEDSINVKSQVIAAKEQIIESKDNELNKVYYVSGTAKELKEKGVIQKEGGFLGLGRNTDLKNSVDKQSFSELDQRTALRLPIFSKKVEVITEHPDSSYQLI